MRICCEYMHSYTCYISSRNSLNLVTSSAEIFYFSCLATHSHQTLLELILPEKKTP